MSRAPTAKRQTKPAAKHSQRTATAKPATVKVTPVRLEPRLRHGLSVLQAVLKTPVNKLINQAVSDFLTTRTAQVETDLEAVLKQVKEYRKRDPRFEKAFRRTVAAEAKAARDGVPDPGQGRTYLVGEGETGPVQSAVRELLSR